MAKEGVKEKNDSKQWLATKPRVGDGAVLQGTQMPNPVQVPGVGRYNHRKVCGS